MSFFDENEIQFWKKEWKELPEFSQEELRPLKSILVHFESLNEIQEFAEFFNRKITHKTRSIWYSNKENKKNSMRFISFDEEKNIPKYPIYIISKGRWENPLTARSLEEMNLFYYIVVEPQEYDEYAEKIDEDKIITLPFSNLGQGSIPARNFVWNHAKESGAFRHWILDDNIDGFVRMYHNKKIPVKSGVVFRALEDFVDRYKNVPMAGLNYRFFAENKSGIMPAFYYNTRVYSCILLQNDVQYEWRGRYNEDTDLSLQFLKDGWCTVLLQAFLCNKKATMTTKGGNTDELYDGDGRWKMAQELVDRHPDVTHISWKWGRWQHHVDYSRFRKNKFKRRFKINKLKNEINEYGLVLQEYVNDEWVTKYENINFSFGGNNERSQENGSTKRVRKRKKRTVGERNS